MSRNEAIAIPLGKPKTVARKKKSVTKQSFAQKCQKKGYFEEITEPDEYGRDQKILCIFNQETIRVLSRFHRVNWYMEERGDGQQCNLPYDVVRSAYAKLRHHAKTHPQHLKPLLAHIDKSLKTQKLIYERNKKQGVISFDDLCLLYQIGMDISSTDEGYLQAGDIVSAEYRSSFMGGRFFEVTANTISHNGESFYKDEKRFRIWEFEGIKQISSVGVSILTSAQKRKLAKRGKRYAEMVDGNHHLHYKGEVIRRSWFGTQRHSATGRCLIDLRAFRMFNENYGNRYLEDEDKFEECTPDSYYKINPWICGFSLKNKRWGEFAVENLSAVKYDKKAFDHLVLDQERKYLIRALVSQPHDGFKDIISGKGGGVIMLLHGPPGVGKTLTAESVAELLERPLYVISMGELGTKATEVEENLSRILEVATLWNAVVLFDEADIFLERRTSRDIERNALVAVFLRLLEYYQGVMFLTTNRVESFDEAFQSRIQLALHYEKLSQDAREKVWKNLLAVASIRGINAHTLAKAGINGRQIKNAIQMSLALAQEKGQKVSTTRLQKIIKLSEQFNEEVKLSQG